MEDIYCSASPASALIALISLSSHMRSTLPGFLSTSLRKQRCVSPSLLRREKPKQNFDMPTRFVGADHSTLADESYQSTNSIDFLESAQRKYTPWEVASRDIKKEQRQHLQDPAAVSVAASPRDVSDTNACSRPLVRHARRVEVAGPAASAYLCLYACTA